MGQERSCEVAGALAQSAEGQARDSRGEQAAKHGNGLDVGAKEAGKASGGREVRLRGGRSSDRQMPARKGSRAGNDGGSRREPAAQGCIKKPAKGKLFKQSDADEHLYQHI